MKPAQYLKIQMKWEELPSLAKHLESLQPPKRQKFGRGGTTTTVHNLRHLSESLLLLVASFVSLCERGFMAVALTPGFEGSKERSARELGQLTAPSRALVNPSTQWRVLDMSCLAWLAEKALDNDVRDLLRCINAKETVERITLPRSRGRSTAPLTGEYLSVLSGSTVIKQIIMLKDAALSPGTYYLPVLQSIIRAERNQLKHIDFPHIDADDMQLVKQFQDSEC